MIKILQAIDNPFIDRPLYYYRRGAGNNISLGQRTYYAAYWSTFAMCEACARRKLNAESWVFPMYDQLISIQARSIMESSKNYRIGRFILAPIRFARRILSRK